MRQDIDKKRINGIIQDAAIVFCLIIIKRRNALYKLDDKHFYWDINKNMININKHGVSFKEAASVFSDVDALYFNDEAHSSSEERFIVIGRSKKLKLLMVCHCYRNGDTMIRLISARKANRLEISQYEKEVRYE